MALITINDLPEELNPTGNDMLAVDGASMRKTTASALVEAARPAASQAEAEAGVDSAKVMTPLRTKQAIDAQALTKAGNLDGLTDVAAARVNLGLGSAAVADTSAFISSAPGSVGAANMAADAIDTANMKDASVTEQKLDPSVSSKLNAIVPGVVITETRTTLKAIDTTKYTYAYLGEGLRSGLFAFKSGDYTAQIASDPLEGLYVKADAVAATSGAWVREGGWAQSGVQIVWFGAVPDANRLTSTGTDSTDAIQAALNLPYTVLLGRGHYRITKPLYTIFENRIVRGEGKGYLWGLKPPNDSRTNFNPETLLLCTGTDLSTRRQIVRRVHRSSAASPEDVPMKAAFENHGMGAQFHNFSIECYADYTNLTPGYFGAVWDIGFFNGCRSSVELHDISLVGYWRRAGFYFDNTRAFGIPGLFLPDGTQIPRGSNGNSGSDKCKMYRCTTVGGRVGLAILGADTSRYSAPDYNPADDTCSYYDWVSNSVIASDERGTAGFSDFRCIDCDIQTTMHHSGYRVYNPKGYGSPLTRANMETEGDNAPAAIFIDGWAGNATTGATTTGKGSIRGLYFNLSRVQSGECFRVRLKQCDEVFFDGRNWWEEGVGLWTRSGVYFDASGNPVNPNDYTNCTYGHLSTDSTYTGMVKTEIFIGGIYGDTWIAYPNTRWIVTDRDGRARRPGINGLYRVADDTNVNIELVKAGGYVSVFCGGVTGTVLIDRSAFLAFDRAGTPAMAAAGHQGSSFQIIAPSTTLTNANVTDGNIGVSIHNGFLQLRNRIGSTANISVTET